MDQLSFDDLPTEPEPERWEPIPGYVGSYEASSLGRIRSLDRLDGIGRSLRGVVLKTTRHRHGYRMVHLTANGVQVKFTVHGLVAAAFHGTRPEDREVRHLDGNPEHNWLSNLVYGTHSENMRDATRHGTNRNAAKTHCSRGHEYNEQNTMVRPGRGRDCIPCSRIRANEAYARRKRQKAA